MVKWNPLSRRQLVIASAPPSSDKAMYLRHLQAFATNIAARSNAMIQAEIAYGKQMNSERGTRGTSIYKGRPMSNTAVNAGKALAGKTYGGKSYEQRLEERHTDAGVRSLEAFLNSGGRARGGSRYA